MMIYTIGHSTRPIEELLEILTGSQVALLADVRRYPGSKRNPQYNREALAASLVAAGIDYAHYEALGGRRSTTPQSTNTAWDEPAFRGYADYMQTPAFEAALDGLIARAAQQATAVMCSEAVPWRCHRTLIADALLARGIEVIHLLGAGQARAHKLTPFARVEGGRVTYPGNGGGSLF